MSPWMVQVATAALGSLGFAMFFGERMPKLIFSMIGGALTWGVYLFGMEMGALETTAYALGAAAGTLYAEILARCLKTPVTLFAITSVIPMVPGGSLYYTMLGLLQGNRTTFVTKGLYTLSVAGAMALGMFAATMLFRIVLVIVIGIAGLFQGNSGKAKQKSVRKTDAK